MLLREITLRNLLSFGPDTPPLQLKPLNVLIGPNGSGKSNLIEAINFLRSAPKHLATSVQEEGGVADWLWKGRGSGAASIQAIAAIPGYSRRPPRPSLLSHTIRFKETVQRFIILDEEIAEADPKGQRFYYYEKGIPILNVQSEKRQLKRADVGYEESILSQRKDPDQYPEITFLGYQYGRIRIYRDWGFGRFAIPRRPQKADQQNDFLNEDFSNLGLVLNRLRRDFKTKVDILKYLRELYSGIQDYDVSVEGGTVQVFFHESNFAVPATRLSDGTLRYLCLLAILCHPEPPPLICIEEPELGLHPDILPTIVRLMKAASERTQLIVTTHSDIIIDELTDQPDSVIICEKHEGRTVMSRLDPNGLTKWLDRYRLGQLWTKGEIGGTRW
jgi:predicted ATPase